VSVSTSNSNSIPFLDLITPHVELERELTEVFHKALHTAGFIGGAMVEDFEKAFAAFCDDTHSIAVSSGTDALRFALMAAGVTSGDVVVTVPHTFIATTEAISQAGALPEFVDIDDRTYNLSPEKLEDYLEQCSRDKSGKLISRRSGRPVTAIAPVHLYGQMADMDAILALAEKYKLIVIEDACQAHGAEYFSKKQNRWMKAGCMGRAAAFSFYPGKIWVPAAKPARLQLTMPHSRRKSRWCGIMARRKSIITTWKATTDGWMPYKPACCTSNCFIWRSGTRNAESTPRNTIACWVRWTVS